MHSIDLFSPDLVRLHGRFARHGHGFLMEYSGACAEFFLRGVHASVTLTADHTGREQYVIFEVDGIVTRRFRAKKGTHEYTVLDSHVEGELLDLLKGAKRHIRIMKDSQANMSGEKGFLRLDAISVDGEVSAPPKRLKIEMIGDSLTSGEGTISPPMSEIGAEFSCDEWCSFYHSWAGFLSRRLNADWQVVSHGGWGVYCAWNNSRDMAIPPIYDAVCGIVPEPVASQRGASDLYDFSFDPDAVVIHLGTNDSYSHSQEAWTNPRTGETYQTRDPGAPDADGILAYHPEDFETFVTTTVNFILHVAEKNPRARILWIYGIMGHAFSGVLREAERRVHELGIDRFEYLLLPDTAPAELGAYYHPLFAVHERVAALVEAKLKPYLPTAQNS